MDNLMDDINLAKHAFYSTIPFVRDSIKNAVEKIDLNAFKKLLIFVFETKEYSKKY